MEKIKRRSRAKHPIVDGKKMCDCCRKVKPVEDFYLNANKQPRMYCKFCYSNKYRGGKRAKLAKEHEQTLAGYPNCYAAEEVMSNVTVRASMDKLNSLWVTT